MRCLNATFTLYFQSGAVVETLEKSSKMLQNFLVRFSVTPIHFHCFELGQQYVLDYMVL